MDLGETEFCALVFISIVRSVFEIFLIKSLLIRSVLFLQTIDFDYFSQPNPGIMWISKNWDISVFTLSFGNFYLELKFLNFLLPDLKWGLFRACWKSFYLLIINCLRLKFKINVQGFKKQTNQKACILKRRGGSFFRQRRMGRKREGALEKLEFFAYFLGQCQKVWISETDN